MAAAAAAAAGGAVPPLVSPQWLAERLGRPGVKVLDVSWYMPAMGEAAGARGWGQGPGPVGQGAEADSCAREAAALRSGRTPRPTPLPPWPRPTPPRHQTPNPRAARDRFAEFKAERIPGARFWDIDGVADAATDLPHMLPPDAAFAAAADALGISNDDTVVVYDCMGLFSAPRAWWTWKVRGPRWREGLSGVWQRMTGGCAGGRRHEGPFTNRSPPSPSPPSHDPGLWPR
jgi:hypothetical protein